MIATQEFVKDLLKKCFAKKETYSTEEVAVGTWVDGKTIYRKCYSADVSLQPGAVYILDSVLNDTYIDSLIKSYGAGKASGGILNIPHINRDNANIQVETTVVSAGIRIRLGTGIGPINHIDYTIEYTKA